MELIKPTQVVKQANVKIAAKRIAPPLPNTCCTIHLKVHAPFSCTAYTPEEHIPI